MLETAGSGHGGPGLVDGLHYEIHGPDGAPWLIASSGLGGSGAYWTPNLPDLSRDFRVLTYDHRGTGRSRTAPAAAETSITAMARDVVLLIEALGIERAHFIGHALGAMIGIEVALETGQIEGLVAINGWRRLSPHTRRCFAARLALLDKAGAEPFLRAQPLFLYPPDWIDAHDAALDAELAHHLATFPGQQTMAARIAAVSAYAPAQQDLARLSGVLAVATRDDFLVPHASALDLAEPVPGARTESFDWGGHAVNVTNPSRFNQVVLDHLGSL